jgi:hypothetical protein
VPLGDPLWLRFNDGAEGTRWSYDALDDVFSQAFPPTIVGPACGLWRLLPWTQDAPRQEGGGCGHSS